MVLLFPDISEFRFEFRNDVPELCGIKTSCTISSILIV